MTSSSQKGPQSAKQITQMQITAALIKQSSPSSPSLPYTQSEKASQCLFSKPREESAGRGNVRRSPRLPPSPSFLSAFGSSLSPGHWLNGGVTAARGGLRNAASQGALRTGCSGRGGTWLAEHSPAFLS